MDLKAINMVGMEENLTNNKSII